MDEDGTPDYKDTDTAAFRHPNGIGKVRLHTSDGNFANVSCMKDDDPALSQNGKPLRDFPYGVNKLLITGLAAGGSVTVTIDFPGPVPTSAQYFKVNSSVYNGDSYDLMHFSVNESLTAVRGDSFLL